MWRLKKPSFSAKSSPENHNLISYLASELLDGSWISVLFSFLFNISVKIHYNIQDCVHYELSTVLTIDLS